MTVLVTGGMGYIGSHTCVELLNAGYDVIILDNLSNSQIEVLDKIGKITGKTATFYQYDLLNSADVEKVFSTHTIDSVIHFAGLKAVGESVFMPLKYYHNNITGTLNLCAAMSKYNCKKLVFSSSATVYGKPTTVPIPETAPVSTATNPYGGTKIMLEHILKDLYVSDPQWNILLLRYFNPIGAHESGLIGDNPCGIPNNLMPYVARVAKGQLPSLGVFGNDYDTPDGTGVRDYIHVVDLAKGHLKAMEKISGGTGIDAINLGTGIGYSVLELVSAFEKANHVSVRYEIQSRRPGDIDTCYADVKKAKKILGWQAEYDLERMCKDTWRFTR